MDEMLIEPDAPPREPAPAPAVDTRFGVPLTIELEHATVPLARLQGMTEGAVVPLDIDGPGIAVRILASGKPFARGTLVSIGDGYGVLIAGDAEA